MVEITFFDHLKGLVQGKSKVYKYYILVDAEQSRNPRLQLVINASVPPSPLPSSTAVHPPLIYFSSVPPLIYVSLSHPSFPLVHPPPLLHQLQSIPPFISVSSLPPPFIYVSSLPPPFIYFNSSHPSFTLVHPPPLLHLLQFIPLH